MDLVLIGYRGCGKSTVGRLLAERLGWPFVETDALIEQRAGLSIREIFARHGEPHFRELEAAVVQSVAGTDGQVISVGGGAVLRPDNLAALKQNGRLVWLTAPPEVLWQRIQSDAATAQTRPNLASGGLEEVREVLQRREPIYRQAADHIIDTTSLVGAQIVEEIVAWISRR